MTLSAAEAQFVLDALPRGTSIVGVEPLPTVGNRARPCLVHVQLPETGARALVLRSCSYWPGVFVEARVFRWLGSSGQPVPEVLSGPALLDGTPYTLQAVLPGSSLRNGNLSAVLKADLLTEGVCRLHALAVPSDLAPRITLLGVLVDLMFRPSAWREDDAFRAATRQLRRILLEIDDPLVFSNGDYMPGNFMTDGERITGFLDLEFAAFQDPLYGLAKFELMPPGTVEAIALRMPYLEAHRKSDRDLAPRLALRCLSLLSSRVDFGTRDKYGEWLFERLHTSLAEC